MLSVPTGAEGGGTPRLSLLSGTKQPHCSPRWSSASPRAQPIVPLNGDPVTKDLTRPVKPKRCDQPNQSLGHPVAPEPVGGSRCSARSRDGAAQLENGDGGGPPGPYPGRAQDNCGGTASVNPQAVAEGSLKGCRRWGRCWSRGTGARTGCPGFRIATGGRLPRRSIPDSFAEDSDGHL